MSTNLKDVTARYQPTIGIECHVQLATTSKLFSGADNDARDAAPNTTVSPICFGFPGVLPVLNEAAVELAVRAGLALNASIAELSRFERKHYFYPDLPKGYQITQLAEPVIVGGTVEVPQLDGSILTVRIHHAHLEEDAGKLSHPSGGEQSLVDLNRAGTPLIEIVSEADIHSPAEARAYVTELYRLMTFAGVTRGDLYHGNMRFDVNISLAPLDSDRLGTRAEIKNLNSFRAVEKAAEYECLRQAKLLDAGETVVQETRGWNEDKQQTFGQRSKEDAHDYRYFPDPDVPPLVISQSQVADIKQAVPMLPPAYRAAWSVLDVDPSVITTLLSSQSFAQLISDVLDTAGTEHAKRVAYWLVAQLGEAGEESDTVTSSSLDVSRLVELSRMVEADQLSSTSAKIVLVQLSKSDESPETIAERLGLLQVSDESALLEIVDGVLGDPASVKAVDDIRAGNDKAIGFLVGQVMKASGGSANPGLVSKLIRRRLQ